MRAARAIQDLFPFPDVHRCLRIFVRLTFPCRMVEQGHFENAIFSGTYKTGPPRTMGCLIQAFPLDPPRLACFGAAARVWPNIDNGAMAVLVFSKKNCAAFSKSSSGDFFGLRGLRPPKISMEMEKGN